jgi:hypothetical protein
MRKFVYLTSFRKLVISEPIRGHLELIPGVNITNDIDVKGQYLTTEFAEAAGAIEMNHFDRASNLVFGEFSDRQFGESPPEGVLRGVLLWINDLFKNAWLLKDHAMGCDAAFLQDDNERSPAWFSNFLAISPSFADGAVWRETEMSISELKAWGSKSDEIEEYLHPSNLAASGFMMAKEYSRLGRALHFVSSARTAPNIAFKIANYCSALETLFTTDETELAHKLSERVAFFLEQKGYNRAVVFSTVKAAYGVRSKLVHGSTIKKGQVEGLPPLSLDCDNYLRAILNTIFESSDLMRIFDSKNEAIETYFSELILGS